MKLLTRFVLLVFGVLSISLTPYTASAQFAQYYPGSYMDYYMPSRYDPMSWMSSVNSPYYTPSTMPYVPYSNSYMNTPYNYSANYAAPYASIYGYPNNAHSSSYYPSYNQPYSQPYSYYSASTYSDYMYAAQYPSSQYRIPECSWNCYSTYSDTSSYYPNTGYSSYYADPYNSHINSGCRVSIRVTAECRCQSTCW